MKLARLVYFSATIYGVLVLLPMYFLKERLEQDNPPPITHVEFYYGFVGAALCWQLVYFLLGVDPVRYRPIMIPAILAKLNFGIACLILFIQGRIATSTFALSSVDLLFAVLFSVVYWRTGPSPKSV
jgi:hypothetical protein